MNYHRGMNHRPWTGHQVGAVETEPVPRCSRCPAVLYNPRATTANPVCSDCWAVLQLEAVIARAEAVGIDVQGMDDETFDLFASNNKVRARMMRHARRGLSDVSAIAA